MQGIEMINITKVFGKKPALKNVSLKIEKGNVHAIIGENGAGKSTLMNILSGALNATSGEIKINGEAVNMEKPQDAAAHKIGMVYQHFMLINSIKVWQNIVLGIEPTGKFGKISKEKSMALIKNAMQTYKLELDVNQTTGKLTIGEQQRVEILKVMVKDAEYIIFDEPTAVLAPIEIEALLENILMLKQMGKTIIFISHKLDEIMKIADKISVLRLGEMIETVDKQTTNSQELVEMMVGRQVDTNGKPCECKKGETVLSVKNLCIERSQFNTGLDNINLDVKQGEILGIAGVDGNGQTQLVDAILGFEKISSGEILKENINLRKLNAAAIRRSGVSLIAPDRQKQGLVMNSSIIRNTILGIEDHKDITKNKLLSHKKVNELVNETTKNFDVRMNSIEDNVSELSGGNQQKVILGREFGLRDFDLAIAVNPTRGLDIGAIEFVYSQLEEQKKQNKAILLVSTELSEIMRLSDRIAVFYKGKCMGILNSEDATINAIGSMMVGMNQEVVSNG